ncbi:MAG: hypothetical protein J6B09_05065, partial [Clostridia bacterium]|nr:hypothetical protein [Clostridia bacterium]
MKFPQWLNTIDLLRKLPKTSGERVILSVVELLRSEMSEAKARGVSRRGISYGIPIAFVRRVTFAKIKPSKLHARPQNALRFARESAQFVARFHSFDSANTAPWCLLR